MPADLSNAIDEAKQAKKAANNATDHSERSFTEAISAAEKTLNEAAKHAEKVHLRYLPKPMAARLPPPACQAT